MRNYAQIVLALVICAAALSPFLIGGRFTYHIAILIGINLLLALSLHLMLRIGQLSLVQAGFMGIGAYASALLTRDVGFPFLLGMLMAIAIPAAIAFVLGTVILKVRGVHFALLTFVMGEAIVLVFVEFVVPFGGNNGLMRIPAASIFGLSLHDRPSFYVFVLVVVGAALLVLRGMLHGQSGRILDGLDKNEALVQSFGIDALGWRRFVFAVSAGIAGASGCLYAHYLSYISPEAFNVITSINALVINVVGGASLIAGPIIGAVLLVPLPELFRSAITYQQFLYGISLLLLMLFMPQGIAGLLRRKK
ncbi:branched-chain amino acid ABC transporter permease [Roseovarius dicentrarchi]|uniref:branched-chain amino acid ABC transporter permease n=1 Tax=Roseovarius dicentrarchi TaxID=2250573 RepID=UPI000DE91C13|nr:branched-chain amino acid ABC transporter permease [Roseovarius dicentrarchi]